MNIQDILITGKAAKLPGDYKPQPTAKGERGENRSEAAFVVYWRLLAADLPEPEREYRFHPTRKWRLDFAWPEYRLGVEIDGQVHAIRGKRNRDAEKSRALNDLDWRVQRYTSDDMRDRPIQVIEEVERILRERMATSQGTNHVNSH